MLVKCVGFVLINLVKWFQKEFAYFEIYSLKDILVWLIFLPIKINTILPINVLISHKPSYRYNHIIIYRHLRLYALLLLVFNTGICACLSLFINLLHQLLLFPRFHVTEQIYSFHWSKICQYGRTIVFPEEENRFEIVF